MPPDHAIICGNNKETCFVYKNIGNCYFYLVFASDNDRVSCVNRVSSEYNDQSGYITGRSINSFSLAITNWICGHKKKKKTSYLPQKKSDIFFFLCGNETSGKMVVDW